MDDDVTGFLVVINVAAGQAPASQLEPALAVLRSAGETEVRVTSSSAETDDVLKRPGNRRLVVCGGDGSLHNVVAVLHKQGALSSVGPIGLIPFGTGNDFARSVGLPLDPAEAARVVVDGVARPRELLVDDQGGIVMNVVHVGIGAEAGRMARMWKRRLGPTAYPIGSVLAGLRSSGWWLRVVVDDKIIADGTVPVLQVALALGTSIGGGSPIAPGAQPDDGLVDVVVSYATRPLARLGYALHLRRGEHVQRDDVHVTLARTVAISGQRFLWNADGELGPPVQRRSGRCGIARGRCCCVLVIDSR